MIRAWSKVTLPAGKTDSSEKKDDSTCSTESGRTCQLSI